MTSASRVGESGMSVGGRCRGRLGVFGKVGVGSADVPLDVAAQDGGPVGVLTAVVSKSCHSWPSTPRTPRSFSLC